MTYRSRALLMGLFCMLLSIAPAGCKQADESKAGGASSSAGANSTGPTTSPSGDARPKPLVAVSLLTLTNPFFKDMGDSMTAQGTKQNFEVVVESGDVDPSKQKDQVKDFLVRKASAIVLTPCDSKSIGTAIQEANRAGVPVFTADVASTAEGAKVVCHVATDNLEGGRVAGRAMVQMLGGKGNVAIIDQPEVESAQMREKGFEEEAAKAPGIHIVAKLTGGGARDKSFSTAQDILQSHPDLDAIFAINDPMALGALAAVEKANKQSAIRIIGFDGQPEARQAVKEGKIFATVMQYPRQIGATTIDTIAKYMAGEDVPKQILLPPKIYVRADAATDTELK